MEIVEIINGQEQLDRIGQRTQVYQLTHDGEGNSLPYLSRSFISFTFGGIAIEDFGLIVTNSDRLERTAYTPFSDITSSYDTLNGQLYWGTKYEPNQLSLTLSTDEMSDKQLDNFREWFAPGENRELILAEHPNRAIMARVSEPPSISMIPFEKKIDIEWPNAGIFTTSTTVYKGDISITFVMDEPIWYAKMNYMPTYVDKYTLEESSLGVLNSIVTLTNSETQKIMYEDGIPHQSVLEGDNVSTFFLGGNILVTRNASDGEGESESSNINIITSESNGLEVSESNPQYLFYSGTATSYPLIQFTLNLTFDNNGYVNYPKNKIAGNTGLSYIAIDNNKMYFTTPSLLTGYNQALYIINNAVEDATIIEIKDAIAINVNEYYSRAWAIGCLTVYGDEEKVSKYKSVLQTQMMAFFDNKNLKVTFKINSKTGEALGLFHINTYITSPSEPSETVTIVQNVGDMICSDYLTIKGRNYFDSNNRINVNNCHKITSDETLTDVLVFFKNMYL